MEFDWGDVHLTMAGQVITGQLLCLRLRWSRMPFVAVYPHQQQEAMFDGLAHGFAAFGGVPVRLTSDNLRQAVVKILAGRNRREQDAYRSFCTHYLVQSNFCNPGAGNEKGSVENLVGFAQRNILGPHLEAGSWEQVQAVLWERCLQYAKRTVCGESEPIWACWQKEIPFLRPLPKQPFHCSRVVPVSVSKIACVQYDTCRYSQFQYPIPASKSRCELTGTALRFTMACDRSQLTPGALSETRMY